MTAIPGRLHGHYPDLARRGRRLGPEHALRQALTLFRRGKAPLLSLIGASEPREVSVPAKEHQQKACRGKKLRPTQENNRFDRWLLQIQA